MYGLLRLDIDELFRGLTGGGTDDDEGVAATEFECTAIVSEAVPPMLFINSRPPPADVIRVVEPDEEIRGGGIGLTIAVVVLLST